jgi:hypothetical protein
MRRVRAVATTRANAFIQCEPGPLIDGGMAALMTKEPDWNALPANTPARNARRLPAAGLENMGLWRSQGMPFTRVGTSAESAFPTKQSISTHTTGFLPDRIEPENTSNLRIGSA